MSQANKLPETPFNGIVTSVIESSMNHYQYKHVAIADLDAPADQPRIVYRVVHLGYLFDALVHIKQGQRVKVKKVELSGNFVLATELEIDQAQLGAPSTEPAK